MLGAMFVNNESAISKSHQFYKTDVLRENESTVKQNLELLGFSGHLIDAVDASLQTHLDGRFRCSQSFSAGFGPCFQAMLEV